MFVLWLKAGLRELSQMADDIATAVNHLFGLPDDIEKFMFPTRSGHGTKENRGVANIPADILESPKEYIFFMDVPGLSKSDIQVTSM